MYSPSDKIAAYKKRIEERGYGFFSDKAIAMHRERYANCTKDTGALQVEAEKERDELMDLVNDYTAEGHEKAREKFYKDFGGDPENIKEAVYSKLCDKNGIGTMPQRKTAYEENILSLKKRNPTLVELSENKAFKDLMRAKWDAEGYKGDDEVINEFDREYVNKKSSAADTTSVKRNGTSAIFNKMTQLQDKHGKC